MLTNNENHILSFCPVLDNKWDFDENAITFRGRPASNYEKKTYNIQKGVKVRSDSLFIYSTNLPENIKADDKVMYLGKIWTVESVGYYLDQNKIIDASIFNEEYIAANSPKGITLH